jgi:hypothetical protein
MIAQILVDNTTGTYAYTVTDERAALQITGLASTLVNGKFVGERFFMGGLLTPGVNCPVIPRYDTNHDVTASGGSAGTNAPLLVAFYRSQAASVPTAGVFYNSWPVTCSGTRITFNSDGHGDGLLSALTADAIVSGFLNGNQASTFSADFTTAATQLYITVNGIDYPISNISTGNRYIDVVSGTPTTGTAIFYPYRCGVTTSIRLRKLSGFVPVATGDYDGEVINGLRCMDRGQGHWHGFAVGCLGLLARYASGQSYALPGAGTTVGASEGYVGPITDGTNGTPRTGKTTSPRSAGGYLYEWAGTLV